MNILAIDPGTRESAYVQCDEIGTILGRDKIDNVAMLNLIRDDSWSDVAVIEMVASYGRPVGREIFETIVWIGRFYGAAQSPVMLITRREVKRALCGTDQRITDSVIRQRLIDIYGPGKESAIGRKASPGPLYGFKKDMWAALAVAVAYRIDRADSVQYITEYADY